MTIEIKVPQLPESVSDAVVSKWYKQAGESIGMDDNLVDLETDKVMLEVPAMESGTIEKILKPEGSTVVSGEVIAIFKPGAVASEASAPAATDAPAASSSGGDDLSPAVRRLIQEHGLDASAIKATGKNGRITKTDVENHLKQATSSAASAPAPAAMVADRSDERVPMSRLRAKVAERLLKVQEECALLTTFNEVNMQAVIDLRKQYKDQFEKEHDTRLGFMSFFVKAAVAALQRFPSVNASIDGDDIVYHRYFDMGIAVGSPRGLVVPIVRDADQLSMADIEKQIRDFGARAKDGKIAIEEMTGGTFTITNGGTFGSMLSTPIINPPQSAILGMHNIVERPVAENGQVVIRPIMYLALSYDHRIIDGRESVLFLRTIKELLEDPSRMLLNI